MDQSTRDRICSRSWTNGQVAVEINWTGPVTLICLPVIQVSQARSDQTPMLLARLPSRSLPATTLSSRDLDDLIQTKPRRVTQVLSCPRPKGGRGHSQGHGPARQVQLAVLVLGGGGGANMALCLEIEITRGCDLQPRHWAGLGGDPTPPVVACSRWAVSHSPEYRVC